MRVQNRRSGTDITYSGPRGAQIDNGECCAGHQPARHQVVAIWFQDCLFAKILRADYSGSAIIAIAVVNVVPSFAKRWVTTEIELLR